MSTFKTKHFSMLAVAFAVMALGSTIFAQSPPQTMFLGEGVTKINMIQYQSNPTPAPGNPAGNNATWVISDFLRKAAIETTANGTNVNNLGSNVLRMGTLGKSSLKGQVLSFEIVAGAIDRQNSTGEVNHTGGITLTRGGGAPRLATQTATGNYQPISAKRVTITGLNIDLGAGEISGLITLSEDWAELHTGQVVARVPIFTIDNITVSMADAAVSRNSRFDTLFVQNLQVKLSSTAAATLESVFGTGLFTAGDHVGWASIFTVGIPARELPDYRDWVLRY